MSCYFYFVVLAFGPECCGECDVTSLYCMCCVFESDCELFGETIGNMFRCGCYFVVECYGSV